MKTALAFLMMLLPSVVLASSMGWISEVAPYGAVLLDNEKTADADFVWGLLNVKSDYADSYELRRVRSLNGEVDMSCQRHLTDASKSLCVIVYSRDEGNFITIDPDFGLFAALEGPVAETMKAFLNPPAEGQSFYRLSPDGHLSVCWKCGPSEAGLYIDWKFSPI